MKKLIALAFSLVASLAQASGGPAQLQSSGADLSDQASLQRGATLFIKIMERLERMHGIRGVRARIRHDQCSLLRPRRRAQGRITELHGFFPRLSQRRPDRHLAG